jgi:hypothetical protein
MVSPERRYQRRWTPTRRVSAMQHQPVVTDLGDVEHHLVCIHSRNGGGEYMSVRNEVSETKFCETMLYRPSHWHANFPKSHSCQSIARIHYCPTTQSTAENEGQNLEDGRPAFQPDPRVFSSRGSYWKTKELRIFWIGV